MSDTFSVFMCICKQNAEIEKHKMVLSKSGEEKFHTTDRK